MLFVDGQNVAAQALGDGDIGNITVGQSAYERDVINVAGCAITLKPLVKADRDVRSTGAQQRGKGFLDVALVVGDVILRKAYIYRLRSQGDRVLSLGVVGVGKLNRLDLAPGCAGGRCLLCHSGCYQCGGAADHIERQALNFTSTGFRLCIDLHVAVGTEEDSEVTRYRGLGKDDGIDLALAGQTLHDSGDVYSHRNRVATQGFDKQSFDFIDGCLRLRQHIDQCTYRWRYQRNCDARNVDA